MHISMEQQRDVSTSVYSMSGLHALGPQERKQRLVDAGKVSRDIMEEATRVIDVDTACKISENVVGVYGLPLAIVPDLPINGRLVSVPMATEEPSVVAAVSRAAKVLRQTEKGIVAACGETLAHGMAHFVIDDECIGEVKCKKDIWRDLEIFIKKENLKIQLDEEHVELVKNGGRCKEIKVVQLSHTEGYFEISVDVIHAMGANTVSRYASQLARTITPQFPNIKFLARIVMNIDDERYVDVKSCVSVKEYSKTFSCSENEARTLFKDVDTLSKLAIKCPARCYTHNKGILNGIEAIALALGQDTRAISIANASLMHKSGHVMPLITHNFNTEDDCLHSEGRIQVPIGTIGGCLKHQHQASGLLQLIGESSDVMCAIASVALCSNLSALIMLAGPGGLETGHIPLARK